MILKITQDFSRLVVIFPMALISICLICCVQNIGNAGSEARQEDAVDPKSVDESTLDYFLGRLPNGHAAWQQFANRERFRLAKPSYAKAYVGEHTASKWRVTQGDFNDDFLAYDVAAIVVFDGVEPPDNYGVIVLSQSDHSQIPELHWILRHVDLSDATVIFSRDGLSIHRYDPDGKKYACRVKWERRERSFFCNWRSVDQ